MKVELDSGGGSGEHCCAPTNHEMNAVLGENEGSPSARWWRNCVLLNGVHGCVLGSCSMPCFAAYIYRLACTPLVQFHDTVPVHDAPGVALGTRVAPYVKEYFAAGVITIQRNPALLPQTGDIVCHRQSSPFRPRLDTRSPECLAVVMFSIRKQFIHVFALSSGRAQILLLEFGISINYCTVPRPQSA